MSKKNELGMSLLENADDSILNDMASKYDPLDKKEADRILARSQRKYRAHIAGRELSADEDIYELKGVGPDMKRNWKKPVMAAAACLLIVGGVIGGTALMKKGGGNDTSSNYYSNEAAADENGRLIVTIGLPYLNETLAKNIKDYNSSQQVYKLEAVNYSQKSGRTSGDIANHSYSEELSLLQKDILTGDVPDIVAFDTDNMFSLINTGMFADMYDFMDKYNGVRREDILPNMLEGFEVDGGLPVIGTDYHIYTAIAKTKFVGKDAENWTIDKFIETTKSIPEDMMILKNSSFRSWNGAYLDNRQNISEYSITKLMNDCIDLKGNTCEFNNSSTIRALEYSLEYPDKNDIRENASNMTDSDLNYYSMEQQWAMLNDRTLVSGIHIEGLGSMEGQDIWSEFGEDELVFVGFPSINGNGAITQFRLLYGIPQSSGNKDGAWDVLSYFISRGNVSKSVLDEQYNSKLRDNDKNIYSKRITWDTANGAGTIEGKLITQERIDQLYNYIQNVKVEPYHSSETESMINEEIAYVLSGERTPDQCIDILNDRIGTYLAENK